MRVIAYIRYFDGYKMIYAKLENINSKTGTIELIGDDGTHYYTHICNVILEYVPDEQSTKSTENFDIKFS